MTNLEAFCIIAAGGTVGGLIAWLAWSLGYMKGGRVVSDHWQDAIEMDVLADEIRAEKRKEFHVAPKGNDWRLNTVAPTPIPDCNCGGLCPGCAIAAQKKIGFLT